MSEDPNISASRDDDALAAEFVLGVLKRADRIRVLRRMARDEAFALRIEAWEARLSGLNDSYRPVPPPTSVKNALDRRLFGASRREAPSSLARLWRSLFLWRGLAMAALLACAILLAPRLMPELGPEPVAEETLVAAINPTDAGFQFVAVFQPGANLLRIAQVDEADDARVLEVWFLAGDDAPVSLGLLDATGTATTSLPAELGDLAAGATLAVSLEPPGGSPTGAPTGPVVAAGDMRPL